MTSSTMKNLTFFAIILVGCLFYRPGAAEVVERIAAIVNDEVILLSEINAAADSYQGMLVGIRDPEARREKEQEVNMKVLEMLIEDELLEQQITELKLSINEKEIDEAINRVMQQNNIPDQDTLKMALSRQGIDWSNYRDEVAKQLRKWRFISAKFSARIKISDEEVKEAYEKEQAMEQREYEYRARHILFRVAKEDPEAKRAMQLAKAEGILQRLEAGDDFATLARQFSEGPTAKFAGDLGYFRKGIMVKNFEKAALALEVGQISGIVETTFGYHIIKLTDKRPLPSRTLEEAEPEIRNRIREEQMKLEMAVWMTQVRNKAYVEVKLTDPPRGVKRDEEPEE